jgi:hypothetical protein
MKGCWFVATMFRIIHIQGGRGEKGKGREAQKKIQKKMKDTDTRSM